MQTADVVLSVIRKRSRRTLESRMMGNCQVRFGGGPMEKCPNRQLASGLPYFISPELDDPIVLQCYKNGASGFAGER
jgi:hypothetical protein